jgi:cysteinyl-tRNA synthetase
MLKLTNTLSRQLEDFVPADGKTVRMYVCGPTVHDYGHIGNFRTFVFSDVLRRHLKSKEWAIRHVMNITDVDDKIILKALAEGVDIRTYTEKYTESFLEDSDALGIERPEVLVRATDHIPEMVDLVKKLIDKGCAYHEGNSVYFRISKFPDYGRLAGLDPKELKLGARVDVDEYDKESPQDFVLWKAPKEEDEPRWDTDIGTGRPGWHLECSAMAMKYLGNNIDIHCGGVDLVFPHHTNEIAQSEAATGEKFVRFWVHSEHLMVEGQKMAKSLGNFYRLRDLLDKGYSATAIRYMFVAAPYGKQFNFTFAGLEQAAQSMERIKEFLFRLRRSPILPVDSSESLVETFENSRRQFEEGLDDDLNTAVALAAMFDLIRASNIELDQGGLGESIRVEIENWFAEIDQRLGIVPDVNRTGAAADPVATERAAKIEALIGARSEARRERDFKLADQIRQELEDLEVVIEDTPDGTRWRYK